MSDDTPKILAIPDVLDRALADQQQGFSASAETAHAAPIAVAAAAPAPVTLQELEAADDPNADAEIDAMLSRPSPAAIQGLSILEELGGEAAAKETPATAADSYGFDKDIAEGGKRMTWPKLGPAAYLELKMLGCKAWKRVVAKARAKYADDSGNIPNEKFEEILPSLMVLSVFSGMGNVVVALDSEGQPMPPLPDTPENRLKLLTDFEGLTVEILAAAKNPKNFRDRSEVVVKN